MLDELERRAALEPAYVLAAAGLEIVEANDVRAVGKQAFAQVRPDESCASGDQRNLPLQCSLLRRTTAFNAEAGEIVPRE